MSKPNRASEDVPETLPAITSLSVAGFKSIVDEQTIEIRPLTLLAGANSSGKSSMMQPLLLLKQTLEVPYDPGPLLLNGPNVKFTSARQFYPAVVGHDRSTIFSVKIELADGTGFTVGFHWKDSGKSLDVGYNRRSIRDKYYEINNNMTSADLLKILGQLNLEILEKLGIQVPSSGFSIRRDHFYLYLDNDDIRFSLVSSTSFYQFISTISRFVLDMIHLPGLRGSPQRTYPVTAIGPRFPGTFENYVASPIAHWRTESPEKIKELSDDLKLLGLTWKIEAKRIEDTQIELLVGRMPRPKQGGTRDLVSIADVGFGVSQTLPVVVALRAVQPGQFVYIEQPEIHLHPRAQVAMARLLVNAANRGVRVVAETHSSLILLGVQALVAEGVIDPSLVGLNWFLRSEKDGTTRLKTAELDEAGRFGDWPEDFDEVALEAENRYLSAAEARLAKR
jgi:hypothetical protein